MSPEHQESEPHKEQDPAPYYLASKFSGERPAGTAYFQSQELIFNAPDCELSVYRFQLSRIYHVAVVGDKPEQQLEDKLKDILSKGEPTSLPSIVLQLLLARRQQQIQHGPWVERHYRPGQPM
jgi:hypothetical protein